MVCDFPLQMLNWTQGLACGEISFTWTSLCEGTQSLWKLIEQQYHWHLVRHLTKRHNVQKFHYIKISDKSQLSDPWKFAYNLKMVLLIYSAFVLFLCSLPETTKTCRKMEPGSLTPYHLICWQKKVSGSTYRSMKGLFLGPKRKKRAEKKRNSLQRSIKFAVWVRDAKTKGEAHLPC